MPKRFDTVAWYVLGPRPGELGKAVMAGHLDAKTGPAIFWRLKVAPRTVPDDGQRTPGGASAITG